MSLGNIPNGWKVKRLGELCHILRGASPRPKGDPRYFGGKIPWIKISDVTKDSGKYLDTTEEFLTEEGKEKSVYLRAETLVVTNSATVGLPKILRVAGCIHDGFLAFLNMSEELERDYLYYYFLFSRQHLTDIAPLGTQRNLNTGIAKALPVPLPPIEIQRRIVLLLDKAVLLKEKREQANRVSEKVIYSMFVKMFGDPLSNPKKWRTLRIREFCEMGTGGTPRRSVASNFGGNIPWVKSGEVNLKYILDTEERLTDQGLANSNARFFPENTILVAMYGATAGKVALLKIQATTNQAICGLMPDQTVVNPSYLQYCLEYLAPNIISQSVGTGQPNLSQEIIGDVEIPIPQLDLQGRFALLVDNALDIQQRQRNSEQEIDKLFFSLMDKVFRGKLKEGRHSS